MLAALFGRRPGLFRDSLRLEGDRIYLRPRQSGDEPAMFAYASDPDVVRFLPWEPAPDLESMGPFLAESTGRRRRGQALDMAIILRETGEMIGQADLMELKSPGMTPELGYILARPWWAKGLMTEAARLILGYAFDSLRLNRIAAFADQENVGSQRVMQKSGMQFCGRETRCVKGEERPYVRYEITRSEWRLKFD